MRIGIGAQRLLRKKKHGMEVVTLELIRHLQEIGHQNEYVVFVKDDEDESCIKASGNFEIRKTPVFNYPYWEQLYLPKLAKEAGVDLLHCTSNTAPVRYHAPMVLTLHDIIYLEKVDFAGTAYQNFGNLYRRMVVPRIIQHCNQIITVSEYEKKRIVDHLQLSDDKVKVVYNAISSNFRVVSDQEVLDATRQKYQLPEQFMLFFGNTAPKKNTPGVIEAYQQYFHNTTHPLTLVITDCTKEYIHTFLGKLSAEEKNRLMSHIMVLDHIPFEELPYMYNLASLFLYPSLRESFGMPIIEAMACGVPVITSNTSSMPEVAGEAALLIDPRQPADMAEGMHKILSSNILHAQMKAAGLKRSALFSWNNTAKQVLQTYQQSVA